MPGARTFLGDTEAGPTVTFSYDATPPAAPSLPALDAATDSGAAGDNLTDFARPRLDGTAESGATVTIYSDGVAVGSGVATGGNYSIALGTALADAAHSITAKASDAAGNTGVASGVLTLTIDTTAPAAPSLPALDAATDSGAAGDNLTDFARPRLDGTAESGATVTIYSDGVAVGSGVATGGNYSIALGTALADAAHSITAKASDAAGNTGVASGVLTLTIDTAVPSADVRGGDSGATDHCRERDRDSLQQGGLGVRPGRPDLDARRRNQPADREPEPDHHGQHHMDIGEPERHHRDARDLFAHAHCGGVGHHRRGRQRPGRRRKRYVAGLPTALHWHNWRRRLCLHCGRRLAHGRGDPQRGPAGNVSLSCL